jgi:predicted ATPase/class 3 adenylate cyclase
VLFADLVDFTATGERFDPEDVRAVQEPYWRNVRAEIERHGGLVEKFIGDAVVALFGAPVAHEDDAERAVRAALAIRDWAREQEAVQVRLAITTGEALVRLGARPLAGEGVASGDVVNTASRLQAAAPANAVLVDEPTRRGTREAIEYAEREPVSAKGKAEPIRVWEALQARSRFGVDLFQHARTPLVGRQRELDVLKDALTRVREERSSQLVTLVGVPGIGKSRLVYELMQVIANDPRGLVIWRQGRSLPYGDGVSFWALAEIVKAQAGILETDTTTEAEGRLATAVQTVVDDRAAAEWVERHLRPLAGLGADKVIPADRGEAFAAWRRFFEALADSRPTVLVFEDLHWGDEALLDFVDSLVEWVRDVPLLIVATARPELLMRRPNWAGGKANATTLSLAALSKEETTRLVADLVQGTELSSETERVLVDRADGNALYAEQYARMWQERGDAEQLPPPETVQRIIAARLDALPASEKGLLQNAAIFGKVFWPGAVRALNGLQQPDVAASLHALERKEFVQRARRSSVAGESEYAFRHVLVRDVAYSQIPRSARVEKHERAAGWIESLGRLDDHAEMLAHHYVTALEIAQAARQSTEALTKDAIVSLIRAGNRASRVNAYPSAAAYYEQALQLLPAADVRRPQLLFHFARTLFSTGDDRRGRALEDARSALMAAGEIEQAAVADTLLADVRWNQAQRDCADEAVRRALTLVRDRAPSPAKADVFSSAARFRMLAAEYEAAVEIGREALEMAETFGLDETRAQTLITVGTARLNLGEDDGARDLERGIELALAGNHFAAAARGYQNLSFTTEDPSRELELFDASEQLWLRLGNVEAARYAQGNRAGLLFSMGRWDEALPLIDAFIADCETGRPHYHEAMMRRTRAWARLGRNDIAGALDDTEKSLVVARAVKDPQTLFSTLGDAADVYARLGRVEDARELAQELIAADPLAPRWSAGFLMVADELGMRDAVNTAFADPAHGHRSTSFMRAMGERRYEDAVNLAVSNGGMGFAADVRVVAAKAWLKEGRHDEARAHLEQARKFYRTVGATWFVGEIHSLLATIEHDHKGSRRPIPRANSADRSTDATADPDPTRNSASTD